MRDLHKAVEEEDGNVSNVSPRSYLDLIHHFVALLAEKRTSLSEELVHLYSGIDKLMESERQVADIQKDLQRKSEDLAIQNSKAEEKLKQIMKDQVCMDGAHIQPKST